MSDCTSGQAMNAWPFNPRIAVNPTFSAMRDNSIVRQNHANIYATISANAADGQYATQSNWNGVTALNHFIP